MLNNLFKLRKIRLESISKSMRRDNIWSDELTMTLIDNMQSDARCLQTFNEGKYANRTN